jgi:hypothetical protein
MAFLLACISISILLAMLVLKLWLSCLSMSQFLACCSALCIFENHMLAFVDFIDALPTRGRKVPNSCFQGEFCIKERTTRSNAFGQGELAFMHFGALFRLNFSCALLPMVSSPFCLTLKSWQVWSILSRLCRALAPALEDQDVSHSSDLFLAFVCLLITCLSFFSLFSFLFLFSLNWLLVCCQCSHRGGDWGPEHPRTAGWSFLAVMSDWQHGVNWLLAECWGDSKSSLSYTKIKDCFQLFKVWCERLGGETPRAFKIIFISQNPSFDHCPSSPAEKPNKPRNPGC